MDSIVLDLKDQFNKIFFVEPIIVRSPGRINIIGEHTDYNEGFVLPAAIDRAAFTAISLRDDDEIHLVASDMDKNFQTRTDSIVRVEDPSWANYILGVVQQFVKRGVRIKGFNLILKSNVPIGAGLSSSAAVECAVALGLNELLQTKFERLELVKMAQKAEQEFAGVMCGIMDQFASMMGKKDHIIKLDCRSLEYEYIPFKLNGYKVVLFNSNVKHSLASSEYNQRRIECETAVKWVRENKINVHSLRDVSEEMLSNFVEGRDKLINARGRFVVQEIERLINGCNDLQRGDLKALGKKMYDTHEGLSKMYEVSCTELDWLVNFVKDKNYVIGSRMMGGGFGGCTINLVLSDCVDELVREIEPAYKQAMKLPLDLYIVSIEDGTEILNIET